MALVRHVVLAILDGLRPDAITAAPMPHLRSLAEDGWYAVGRTVRPSVTVAALTSLATGVAPDEHGVVEPSLPPLGRLSSLRPLPAQLHARRLTTTVVTTGLPGSHRLAARGLLSLAGVTRFLSHGTTPIETAACAADALARERPSLLVLYLNHADRAGHAAGWMSAPYLGAARMLDAAVGHLGPLAERDDVLLLTCADHGGGGVRADDHDEPHPLNDAIPIIAAGGPARGLGAEPEASPSLLDLPATICAALGVPAPAMWTGRPLPFTRPAGIRIT